MIIEVDKLLLDFKKSGAKDLLVSTVDAMRRGFDYINDFYAVDDKVVNFYQPTKHFNGGSVWVRVLDKKAFEEIARDYRGEED